MRLCVRLGRAVEAAGSSPSRTGFSPSRADARRQAVGALAGALRVLDRPRRAVDNSFIHILGGPARILAQSFWRDFFFPAARSAADVASRRFL